MTPTPSLQQEIKQGRPFRSKQQAATVSILRTASLLHHRFEELAQQEGVTFQQYNILRILRGAGKPLPTMEIGERLVEQTPGITRLLDRLESKGLVRRERCRNDRRQVLCETTPAALQLLEKLDAPFDNLDDAVMAGLGEDELDALLHVLAKVRAAAQRTPPDAGALPPQEPGSADS